jgi:hypothetical protein
MSVKILDTEPKSLQLLFYDANTPLKGRKPSRYGLNITMDIMVFSSTGILKFAKIGKYIRADYDK